MNTASRIASIIETRKPLAEKIKRVEANLETLASALRELEARREQVMARVDDQNVAGRLKEIDLATIQRSLASELEAIAKLKVRFSRDTLNIGVVGRARQGKSRLLQSLTGLSAAEIPDGDRQHCTGVRSTIYHNPNVKTHGEVWFHSERSFLDEVISPYYDKLHLGANPITVEEFARKPLPALPLHLPGYAEPGAMYEHLSRYHTNIEKYRHLLREASPRQIEKEEIREYVAQDTVDGQRVFFNYLAVKEVKIVCNFPNSEVGQIALVDMPGLGDTGVGDEERLMKTLGRDVDAVLFVRMPKSSGDYWADVDVRLYDTARAALVELPINLWSFMVLNKTGESAKNGDNSHNCKDLEDTIEEKRIEVVECAIANCANVQETNKVLDRVLDYLAAKIAYLDRQYASYCQERLERFQSEVKAELDKASHALGKAKQPAETGQFEVLFNQLWKDLTSGLEKLLRNLDTQINAQDSEFKAEVEATLCACRKDTKIPSEDEIEVRRDSEKAYGIAYEKYLNEIRAHLSQQFLSLDNGLKRSLDRVKSQVAEVLVEKGRLGGLTSARGSEFIKAIAEELPDQIIPGEASRLKFGFKMLSDFKLSYRGTIQHRIRRCLDGLTPDKTTLKLSQSPNARQIRISLKTLYAEAVYECEKALGELLSEPSQAAFAIVEEFLDRVLRAEGVESEWRIFLNMERSTIWSSEFEQLGERTKLWREWLDALERAAAANQSDSMQFLN